MDHAFRLSAPAEVHGPIDAGGGCGRRRRSLSMTHGASTAESSLPPLVPGPYRHRIGVISIVACLGGLLFGYDTGVANGAEGPLQTELGLTDLQLGVVISSLVFAAALGALVGGKISDAI